MSAVIQLSQLKAGAEAQVKGFTPLCKHAPRLREMGLLPGSKIKLIRWAPLGDPLEIQVRGYLLSLRKSEAEQVEVLVPSA